MKVYFDGTDVIITEKCCTKMMFALRDGDIFFSWWGDICEICRGKMGDINIKFCPFCGEKIVKEEGDV